MGGEHSLESEEEELTHALPAPQIVGHPGELNPNRLRHPPATNRSHTRLMSRFSGFWNCQWKEISLPR
jgi:hypothetical protein